MRIPLPTPQAVEEFRTSKDRIRFVAIDGEAIEGRYCLLGSSENQSIYNAKGLTTDEILDFLFDIDTKLYVKNPQEKRVYVFFAGHYDVNMFFREFSDEDKDIIFGDDDRWVEYLDYKIQYKPKKKLTISREHFAKKRARQVINLFDSFSFFNSSFTAATKKFYGTVPEVIQWGKKARVSFTSEDVAKMNEYNNAECEILVDMMNRIAGWLSELGVNTGAWYGPSALADRALKELKIQEDQTHFSKDGTPEGPWEAIIHSFFGGRIEAFNLGTIPSCINYDINSAYPRAMLNLPILKSIDQWIPTNKFREDKPFGIYHVRWDTEDARICPFPWRTKSGLIMFPPMGEGWYHYPEVQAAIETHGKKHINIIEGYYIEGEKSRLSQAVQYLYDERQKLKAVDNPAEYILKILLNSLYGKFAQSTGHPQYQCLPWAGYITSYTRAQLQKAVRGYEKDIIAFATDGIFSRVELPHLPISKTLGEWSRTDYDKITVLMSGVYRKYKGDETLCICSNEEMALQGFKCPIHIDATRGYKSASNLWDIILDALNKNTVPKITTRQFITYKMGRNRVGEKREEMYKFIDSTKKINPALNDKRRYFLNDIKNWRTDSCDSVPNFIAGGEKSSISYPYKLKSELRQPFSDDAEELMLSEDGEILPL